LSAAFDVPVTVLPQSQERKDKKRTKERDKDHVPSDGDTYVQVAVSAR
jgi:hypothetical protein